MTLRLLIFGRTGQVATEIHRLSEEGLTVTTKQQLERYTGPYTLDAHQADTRRLGANSFRLADFKHNHIRGEISAPGPRLVFFSIPHEAGWTARLDGAPAKIYRTNIGFMGVRISRGDHRLELRYSIPWLKETVAASLLGLLIWGWLCVRQMKTRRRGATA